MSGSFMFYAFLFTPDQQGIGVGEADLDHLMNKYRLVYRKDGTERGQRPSAWFIFERK
jgi:hypothetical protein